MMYGWGWAGWIMMTVLMVLLWAPLITAIVLAIRYLSGTSDQRNQGTDRPPGQPKTCWLIASPAATSTRTTTGAE